MGFDETLKELNRKFYSLVPQSLSSATLVAYSTSAGKKAGSGFGSEDRHKVVELMRAQRRQEEAEAG